MLWDESSWLPRRGMKACRVEERSTGVCEERRRLYVDSVPSSHFAYSLSRRR